MWKHIKTVQLSDNEALFNDLFDEVVHSMPGARISFAIRNRLESIPFEVRKEVVNRLKNGCSPLFLACKDGQQEIVEYLVISCGSDIEQKGTYEVQQDRSNHIVTPLWCASVSGKLGIVQFLLGAGADINSVSDSGSTPVRSACFMTHFEVVKYLVAHGADINKPNYNGGTCLINSVQSATLCHYLLKNGADVNAKDIQNKTALHYAIQEHRLETTKLLLRYGADYTAQSRYGDDALQMACLKGAIRIFEHLITTINYGTEKLANAQELMGATFLDEHNNITECLRYWKQALKIRDEHGLHPKMPIMPPQEGYRNQREFETEEELMTMSTDLDKIRVQSLLIAERILGTHHKDTIFRLMYRGASYADVMRYPRCIELWRRALQIRIEKDTVLYTDTCFTAQALVKLMIDFNLKSIQNDLDNFDQRFNDIVATFKLLTNNIMEMRTLLMIRPQYKRQLEFFEKIIRCVTHLIYLMLETAVTQENKDLVVDLVRDLISNNVKCLVTGDTIFHLCVSSLNTIKSSYFLDEEPIMIFPTLSVIKLLLDCGANVNARNKKGLTPLHAAVMPHNYSTALVKLLLDHGAHLDLPDGRDYTPMHTMAELIKHKYNIGDISLMNYTTLKCLCASSIVSCSISYEGKIPKTLENFVKLHGHNWE